MDRHLLLTVSERTEGLSGVRFVGHFFSQIQEMKLTLFYLTPRSPDIFESDPEMEMQTKKWEAKGRQALQGARAELLKTGFKEEQIITKLRARRVSKVMDIVQEGADGRYDAIVLGRRGLSWMEAAFDESVTKGLLEQTVDFPIWICRKPDLNRRNVLACVDGSEASIRMLDHIGFILAQHEDHMLTLLLVTKKGKISDRTPEDVLSESMKLLEASGFAADRIRTKVIHDGSPGKTILKEAAAGGFAAVAVGRTGTGKGLMQKIFVGSVSDTLFHELEGASLWLV